MSKTSHHALTDRTLLRLLQQRTGFDFADLVKPGNYRVLNDERDEHLRELRDPVRALDGDEMKEVLEAEWNFYDSDGFLCEALAQALSRALHGVNVQVEIAEIGGREGAGLARARANGRETVHELRFPLTIGEAFGLVRALAAKMFTALAVLPAARGITREDLTRGARQTSEVVTA